MKFVELFTIRQIVDCSKLKQLADDHIKFNKNGINLSTRMENIEGKAEISRYDFSYSMGKLSAIFITFKILVCTLPVRKSLTIAVLQKVRS